MGPLMPHLQQNQKANAELIAQLVALDGRFEKAISKAGSISGRVAVLFDGQRIRVVRSDQTTWSRATTLELDQLVGVYDGAADVFDIKCDVLCFVRDWALRDLSPHSFDRIT